MTTLIGLCGRSGSGKGYISAIFKKYGAAVIDTDRIYHTLTSSYRGAARPLTRRLSREFGDKIVLADGSLDRKALAAVVFNDKKALCELDRIAHREIISSVKRRCEFFRRQGRSLVIIDAPLLFESGLDGYCDFTLAVVAGDETAISRIMKRDGITYDSAKLRLSSQLSCEKLYEKCDFVIVNDTACESEAEVRRIIDKINLR